VPPSWLTQQSLVELIHLALLCKMQKSSQSGSFTHFVWLHSSSTCNTPPSNSAPITPSTFASDSMRVQIYLFVQSHTPACFYKTHCLSVGQLCARLILTKTLCGHIILQGGKNKTKLLKNYKSNKDKTSLANLGGEGKAKHLKLRSKTILVLWSTCGPTWLQV